MKKKKKIVANSGTFVAQCCESNQNNNVGLGDYSWAPRVILGVDGMHNDMLRSAKASLLLGQQTEGASMSTIYNRFRAGHDYLNQMNVPGHGANNLVIMNYHPPTPLTNDNFLGHFFYGLSSSEVETVIAQGRVIVKDGHLVSVDEESIMAEAQEQARRLWNAMG
ncbi:MAG: hypothetical protein ACRCTY_03555 [Candidatus Adiutrix sp.]